MHDRSRVLAYALLVAFGAACSSASGSPAPRQPPPAASTTPAPGAPRGGGACPAGAGVRVTTMDTPGGVALEFTTTSDVATLQARVHRMADMHNRMMGGGMQGSGMMGSGMQGGGMQGSGMMGSGMQGGMMRMVPSRAAVEDIPGGARLMLSPADPSQLGALRDQARRRAAMMQQGRCPIMQPPAATPPAEPSGPSPP